MNRLKLAHINAALALFLVAWIGYEVYPARRPMPITSSHYTVPEAGSSATTLTIPYNPNMTAYTSVFCTSTP